MSSYHSLALSGWILTKSVSGPGADAEDQITRPVSPATLPQAITSNSPLKSAKPDFTLFSLGVETSSAAGKGDILKEKSDRNTRKVASSPPQKLTVDKAILKVSIMLNEGGVLSIFVSH